jgi:hypothetical protein
MRAGLLRKGLRTTRTRGFRSGRGAEKKTTKKKAPAAAAPAAPAAPAASRTDTKVLDAAKSTRSARAASGASGVGPLGTTLFLGLLGGTGYGAYRLNSDPEFATTLRGFGLGRVVDAVGSVVPLAAPAAAPAAGRGKELDAAQERLAALQRKKQEAEAAAAATAAAAAAAAAAAEDTEDTEDAAAATAAADDTPASTSTGTTDERAGDGVETTASGGGDGGDGIQASGTDGDGGEAAVAAVLVADSQGAQAEELVEKVVEQERDEALAVAAEAPAPSELDMLRDEIRGIEDSVAEEQAEARRNTVAQLQVQQAELRGELEDMLARDLSELDMGALRKRVVQLVMELQVRSLCLQRLVSLLW